MSKKSKYQDQTDREKQTVVQGSFRGETHGNGVPTVNNSGVDFYKWLGTGGTASRRTANKKLTKLY